MTMASLAVHHDRISYKDTFQDTSYQDLAPQVLRQRLVVEGYPARPISDSAITDYLCKLSDFIGMTTLIEPVTHRSDLYGWAGWIHWETSGAHFYAWERPLLFFSVDIYSCKAFDVAAALEFTRRYFDATKLSSKSF
jgi:S-adenosylmethionine decarboxylase